ncbi:MAG TPA: hypothetical protein VKD22_12370 [Ramlibacter sp.]|nr:hypothetical protein [Ramlibacter sp.]
MNRLKNAAAILDAIDEVRAMPADPDGRAWTVCFRAPSGEVIGQLRMPSYEHVSALQDKLQPLGYRMSILHPQRTGCDFVFQELSAAGPQD